MLAKLRNSPTTIPPEASRDDAARGAIPLPYDYRRHPANLPKMPRCLLPVWLSMPCSDAEEERRAGAAAVVFVLGLVLVFAPFAAWRNGVTAHVMWLAVAGVPMTLAALVGMGRLKDRRGDC